MDHHPKAYDRGAMMSAGTTVGQQQPTFGGRYQQQQPSGVQQQGRLPAPNHVRQEAYAMREATNKPYAAQDMQQQSADYGAGGYGGEPTVGAAHVRHIESRQLQQQVQSATVRQSMHSQENYHPQQYQLQQTSRAPLPPPYGHEGYAAQSIARQPMLRQPMNRSLVAPPMVANPKFMREPADVPYLCQLGGAHGTIVTDSSNVQPPHIDRGQKAYTTVVSLGAGMQHRLLFNAKDYVDVIGCCVVQCDERAAHDISSPMLAVQPLSRVADVMLISKELQSALKDEPSNNNMYTGNERIVAAKYDADKSWYRCIILCHYSRDKYKVYFVDFGNVDVVSVSNVRTLPFSLRDIAPCALQVTLRNAGEINMGDLEAFKQRSTLLTKHLTSRHMEMVAVDSSYDAFVVDLYVKDAKGDMVLLNEVCKTNQLNMLRLPAAVPAMPDHVRKIWSAAMNPQPIVKPQDLIPPAVETTQLVFGAIAQSATTGNRRNDYPNSSSSNHPSARGGYGGGGTTAFGGGDTTAFGGGARGGGSFGGGRGGASIGGSRAPPTGPCPNCHKPGHWRYDCPEAPSGGGAFRGGRGGGFVGGGRGGFVGGRGASTTTSFGGSASDAAAAAIEWGVNDDWMTKKTDAKTKTQGKDGDVKTEDKKQTAPKKEEDKKTAKVYTFVTKEGDIATSTEETTTSSDVTASVEKETKKEESPKKSEKSSTPVKSYTFVTENNTIESSSPITTPVKSTDDAVVVADLAATIEDKGESSVVAAVPVTSIDPPSPVPTSIDSPSIPVMPEPIATGITAVADEDKAKAVSTPVAEEVKQVEEEVKGEEKKEEVVVKAKKSKSKKKKSPTKVYTFVDCDNAIQSSISPTKSISPVKKLAVVPVSSKAVVAVPSKDIAVVDTPPVDVPEVENTPVVITEATDTPSVVVVSPSSDTPDILPEAISVKGQGGATETKDHSIDDEHIIEYNEGALHSSPVPSPHEPIRSSPITADEVAPPVQMPTIGEEPSKEEQMTPVAMFGGGSTTKVNDDSDDELD